MSNDIKCTFKVQLDFDLSIEALGELDTSDKSHPIKWLDYGLHPYFPNNPFNSYIERPEYDRFEDLRNAVNNDLNTTLLNCLIENADKKVNISFGKYWVLVNGGNEEEFDE